MPVRILILLSFMISGFCLGQNDSLTPDSMFEYSFVNIGYEKAGKRLSNTLDSLGISKIIIVDDNYLLSSDGVADTLYIENGIVTKHIALSGTSYEYLYTKNAQLAEKTTFFGDKYVALQERFKYDSSGMLTYHSKFAPPNPTTRLEDSRFFKLIERSENYYNEDGTPDSVISTTIYTDGYAIVYSLYDYKHSNDSVIITKTNTYRSISYVDQFLGRTSGNTSFGSDEETYVYRNGFPINIGYRESIYYITNYGAFGLPAETYDAETGSLLMEYEYYVGKSRLEN